MERTQGLRKMIDRASVITRQNGQDEITPGHLLEAMVAEPCDGSAVLRELHRAPDEIRSDISRRLKAGMSTSVGKPIMSHETERVLAQAEQEAQKLGHDSVGTGHVLLALTMVAGTVAHAVLQSRGVNHEAVHAYSLSFNEVSDQVAA